MSINEHAHHVRAEVIRAELIKAYVRQPLPTSHEFLDLRWVNHLQGYYIPTCACGWGFEPQLEKLLQAGSLITRQKDSRLIKVSDKRFKHDVINLRKIFRAHCYNTSDPVTNQREDDHAGAK